MHRESLRYASSLIVAGLAILGVYLLLQLLVELREVMAVLFLGVVVGIALTPVASYFTRWHVPRAASVLAVYALIAGVMVGFVWYAAPEVGRELDALPDRLESQRADYERMADNSRLPPLEDLERWADRAFREFSPSLVSQAATALSVLAYCLTILVVGLFYTQVQGSARMLFLSLVGEKYRERADEVMSHIAVRMRRYVIGELIGMVIVGVATYIGLLILGMPLPFLLAVIAFVTEILPIVGPWIGFVPALVVAATQGWEMVIAVSIFYAVLQQLESNVIQPLVQKRQTELPPFIVLAAILIGGALMGILGALVALPVAIVIQTIVMDVVVPWRQRQNGLEPEDVNDAEPLPGMAGAPEIHPENGGIVLHPQSRPVLPKRPAEEGQGPGP